MPPRDIKNRILVMGVGNTLMQDDGVGIHVTRQVCEDTDLSSHLNCVDGGTIGLALLPELEQADALIMVDASELNANPGHVAVFHDSEIDRQLGNKRRTVHEVALADLLSAAGLRGHLPRRRALVAIQPESTDWGLDLTASVQAAVPAALDTVKSIAKEWLDEVT
jgi:hydrogenase maturation protease